MKFSHLSLLVMAASLTAACSPDNAHRPRHDLLVETYEVNHSVESQFRNFNGQVMPAELTPLSFRLDGEISAMLVKEGDSVTKGQVVALLDDSKAKQALIDAQVRYELALKQQKRGENLRQENMISSAELDQLSANLQLAQANLGLAKAQMHYTRLKAPFDGVIASVEKKKFENATPGESVVSLYQSDNVYVKIEVSDSVLAMLNPTVNAKQYQPVATFSGLSGSYPMRYLEHTSELHPQTQTYQLWLSMPALDQRLLPGTSAKISVDLVKAGLSQINAYQVPMTAIDAGRDQQAFYVWKLEDGKAHRYAINVDQITGQGALVASGIEQGDVLINSNLRKLREGMDISGAQL
ncbi:efflux RND transporter periplasmic adaptor subunit [Vibrio scophthalmi]|uniref:efflux RND transporter periplasmic adaptor subunit n=1 Tax=Vibrio scophthalmi TaxID=45658 RepID=UPI002FF363F8